MTDKTQMSHRNEFNIKSVIIVLQNVIINHKNNNNLNIFSFAVIASFPFQYNDPTVSFKKETNTN